MKNLSDNFFLSKYRSDIDGLRAIAVLTVIFFHIFSDYPKLKSLIGGGFVGVDIFFVISGYLISKIILSNLKNNTFSFIEFYNRRIIRIFPALIVILIFSIFVGWIVLTPSEYKQLGKHIISSVSFISNFVLWKESGYFDSTVYNKPLLHLWSLSIEWQFYIFYPILIVFLYKKNFNYLVITVLILLISFFLNLKSVFVDTVATFYSPQTRFWELMIGSLLAYYMMSEGKVKSRILFECIFFFKATNKKNFIIVNLQSTVGIIAIIIAISITNQKYFPGYWPLLPTLGAALIINSEKSYINCKILSNRLLVLIGLISYPLYLWHWTLFSFAKIIYNETLSTEIRIILILISFLFSVFTFYLIEKPARSIILRFKYLILIITIIFIGVFGYIIFKYNGFESRLPKIISEVIRYNENPTKEFYRAGSCFLNEDQDFIIFNNCAEDVSLSKKTILLWGDSHAAHLYPGYKKYYENNFNIRQRTASGCPPIINYDINLTTSKLERQFCRSINYHIINELKELQPEIVVLSANWILYDSKKIHDTIIELKKINRIKKIYIIGAGPHWKNGLPKNLFLFWKKNKSQTVPFRMNYGLELKKSIDINLILEEIAKNTNITFISPIKILCDEDGCLTRLNNSSDSLIIWDSDHLTVKGSEYLVSKFLNFF